MLGRSQNSLGASYAGCVAVIFATGPGLVAVLLWCLRDVSLDDPAGWPAGAHLDRSRLPQR